MGSTACNPTAAAAFVNFRTKLSEIPQAQLLLGCSAAKTQLQCDFVNSAVLIIKFNQIQCQYYMEKVWLQS